MIKKIFTFLICFLPWLINNLFKLDYNYYDIIKKPFFAPPKLFYPISWILIYLTLAFSIYSIISTYKFRDIPKSYKITLIINYLFNQSYTVIFFGLKNNFFGFISCLATFISALFLTEESSLLNSKISKLLYPYILLSLFGTILSLSIFLLNI